MNRQFALYERLAGVDFGDLPDHELRIIWGLPQRVAQVLWHAWVSERHDHLGSIPASDHSGAIARWTLDWDDKASGRRLLEKLGAISSEPQQPVVHFWSPLHAVATNAGLFVRRWDDYWYPSDDNCALVLPKHSTRIEFIEERVALYELRPRGMR